MGDMVNTMAEGTHFLDQLKPVINKFAAFNTAQIVSMFINMHLRSVLNSNFMRDLRRNLFRSFLNKDIEYNGWPNFPRCSIGS